MTTDTYDFHGVRIVVAAEDPPLADAIRGRLRHFATANADAVDLELTYRIVADVSQHAVGVAPPGGRHVYDPPAGSVLYVAGEDAIYLDYESRVRFRCDGAGSATISALDSERGNLWLLSRPMFTLPLIELLKRRGLYSVHASGVAIDGRAALLAGGTGSGKSTLALALARDGFDFLGDDMLFLRATAEGDVRVLAFPDELDVAAESAAWFPELAAIAGRESRPGWTKHQVRAEDAFGSRFVADATPALLVFPQISTDERSRLDAVPPDEALLELAPNVLLTEPIASQAHLTALGSLTQRAPSYRLHAGRDFGRIAALIRERLG